MGTLFSVVYAVIFMICFETPIVNDVRFSCLLPEMTSSSYGQAQQQYCATFDAL